MAKPIEPGQRHGVEPAKADEPNGEAVVKGNRGSGFEECCTPGRFLDASEPTPYCRDRFISVRGLS